MLNYILNYECDGNLFSCIGQPIINNSNLKIERFEILSRNESIGDIECFFNGLNKNALIDITCKQMYACVNNISDTWREDDKFIHININESCLCDDLFIDNARNSRGVKFAFEIDNGDLYLSDSIADSFKLMQSLGHEIWLDDFGVKDKNIDVLLRYPWDGVKVDKSILWRSSHLQIKSLVELCHAYTKMVILEGVEDSYLNESAKLSGAEFSQGFFWPLIKN